MAIGFNHEQVPVGLKIAQAVGLTASAYLFGQNASISYIGVPALMQAPAPLAVKQWDTVYSIGKKTAPALAVVSSLALGYVTYHLDPRSLHYKLNLAATILIPSIIPYTFAFIVPTNKKLYEKLRSLATTGLEDKAAEVGVAKKETVNALLDKWATLNLIRALLAGAGAVLAAWGTVSHLQETVFIAS
ncbi:uncharacterized protein EI97DRAFT_459871 [Westerdykella ornata]|uniref:DUF1772-domain-containing protein n=1 Tax=Westerdykella ornata TaxID=318751 RepID=A0A6A6JG08_WESOR|nr:uncharacterized protein EI97DRAFT_459871 [Westerdykella ornata]KAF2274918.1 hypothetical protein EI97DRAFT_459871 [Westerdykella ornata]